MKTSMWFEELPVLGKLPPEKAAIKLRELGDEETANILETAHRGMSAKSTFALLEGLFKPKAWQHTAHAFGYLAPASPGSERLPILHAGNIAADSTLKNSRLKISLNRLRVAGYPGGGMHRILFDFYALNQLPTLTEELHFNSTCRVQEGEQAGIIGYPIFIGLNVGTEGLAFRCYTVNVKNDADETFLNFLESDVAKTGLRLAAVAQPSLGPFVKLAMGLTKSIAQRNRNVPVQDFYLGLDFSRTAMGARLAEGDYVAVQIPETLQSAWNWDQWGYDPNNGHIVNRTNPTRLCPYNYAVIGVSRYEGT
jgi:hypothetical protein